MTVFKIQIPLGGSLPNDDGPLLAYPRKGHPVFNLWPHDMDAADLARIRADCAKVGKAYYDCTVDHSTLVIGARVSDQRW